MGLIGQGPWATLHRRIGRLDRGQSVGWKEGRMDIPPFRPPDATSRGLSLGRCLQHRLPPFPLRRAALSDAVLSQSNPSHCRRHGVPPFPPRRAAAPDAASSPSSRCRCQRHHLIASPLHRAEQPMPRPVDRAPATAQGIACCLSPFCRATAPEAKPGASSLGRCRRHCWPPSPSVEPPPDAVPGASASRCYTKQHEPLQRLTSSPATFCFRRAVTSDALPSSSSPSRCQRALPATFSLH